VPDVRSHQLRRIEVELLALMPAALYCTDAGPMEITENQQFVHGEYTIVFNGDKGTIDGTLTDGAVNGRWNEPGKAGGPIKLYFGTDQEAFAAFYATQDAPDQWHGWIGRRADIVDKEAPDAGLFCTAESTSLPTE
jgi:hypothetical protein